MEQIQKPEARSPWSRGPAETTGVLKIFFGYAAGVGKTYAMLEAAHQAQKEGIDVVARLYRASRPAGYPGTAGGA